jgi:hypothetical protein
MYNKYKRVLLKLSGEALANKETKEIFDAKNLEFVASAIKAVATKLLLKTDTCFILFTFYKILEYIRKQAHACVLYTQLLNNYIII